ncbi:hypothetical protein SRHO_G00293180 [Serrasalmus rhombeus]
MLSDLSSVSLAAHSHSSHCFVEQLHLAGFTSQRRLPRQLAKLSNRSAWHVPQPSNRHPPSDGHSGGQRAVAAQDCIWVNSRSHWSAAPSLEPEWMCFGSKGDATSSQYQPTNIDMLMMCNSANKRLNASTGHGHNGP